MTAAAVIGGWLVLAAISAEVPEPWATLLAYGPLGIMFALYVTGRLPSPSELKREIERANRAEEQRDLLTERSANDLIPLVRDVQKQMIPSLERLVVVVERLADDIERLDKEWGGR